MMRFNVCGGPVITQMTNTQNMNIFEMSRQKIPNYRVCSTIEMESNSTNTDKKKLHVCYTDKRESKMVIANAYSSDKSKSKIVHISVNTSEVKDANNETNGEEPSVTDILVINTPNYFKLFECNKNFLKN